MKLIEIIIPVKSRSDVFSLYPFGDVHIGARNCAEHKIKKQVRNIQQNDKAYWIGGGDMLDAIKPQDAKRFDFNVLPDWMLESDAETTRQKLSDVLMQQRLRFKQIFNPIKDKCIGMIEGNHCYSIKKYYNDDIHQRLVEDMNSVDLTDEAFVRLRFKRGNSVQTVKVYLQHGFGGGRSAGAEPNHLTRMIEDKDCDVAFRGHSHTFCILPPKPVMGMPSLLEDKSQCTESYKWAANWGCWMYSHRVGKSTYASRASYPARPLMTCRLDVKPFDYAGKNAEKLTMEIRAIPM